MPATRRKAVAQPAPQTIEEATALLGRYAGMLTEVEKIRAGADELIARIQATRDHFIAPIEEEARDLFLQLRAWWGVAGPTLTEGKRKSYELAGCVLGVRTTPPSLGLVKMKVPDAIETLLVEKLRDHNQPAWDGLVRTKLELDKPAILKALAGDAIGDRLTELGFRPRQRDEFFIDRAAPKPANPEIVDLPEAAE